jgi:hypothetical protein
VRYPKQKINGHAYPIALIVYVMGHWREPYPCFGVRYLEPGLPPDQLNRLGNIVPASRDDVATVGAERRDLTVGGGRKGGHLSNNSEGKTGWWRENRNTDVGQMCIEALRSRRDNEHERAVNRVRSYSHYDEKDLTEPQRQWLETCREIVARRGAGLDMTALGSLRTRTHLLKPPDSPDGLWIGFWMILVSTGLY